MPDDTVVLRSARNAFGAMLLLLLGFSTYQFYDSGGVTTPVAALWITGAGAFYASKYYYGDDEDASGGETEKD